MLRESEREEIVMTMVAAALEQPPEARSNYIRNACPDEEVRAEVEERVEWEQRMGDFLKQPLPHAFDFFGRPFSPGDEVAGRFLVIREVGRGGMGVVYEAFDRKLNRRVALKTAFPGFGDRLSPETRAATAVSHFNVCKVYDLHAAASAVGDVEFLSMEFIEGETLSARILRDGPLPRGEALDIAQQICAGLSQAHRLGVIHGDLKPGNIILNPVAGGLRAVITDFGLATLRLESAAGPQGGSLDYMAPELFAGERRSIASDIYALGATLHFVLTGTTPARIDSPATDASTRTAGPDPAPVRDRGCAPLPLGWHAVVGRCLREAPEDRFPSADDVSRHLPVPATRRQWLGAAAASLGTLAAAVWLARRPPVAMAADSIAVIPFVNAGGPQNQYLSEGLSEGLIHALSQLPQLKVIARTSSFRFQGHGLDARKAARSLGARTLVTGRVAEMNGRLRITVELIDGSDGTQIWGSHYNPGVADLPVLQAEVSRELAERVSSGLSGSDRVKLAKGKRTHPEAYALFLRGRYELRLYSPESRQKAVGYYEQALAIDPAFALAHAELASAYRLLSGSGVRSAEEMMPKAEAAALRAVGVDRDLAEAHAALAGIKRDRWEWRAAEREYRRAIELNPNLVSARHGYAVCLSVAGRHEAAEREVARARELDPLGVAAGINVAAVYYNARRYEQALAALRRVIEHDPAAPSPWMWMGIVHGGAGNFTEATAAYRRAAELGDRTAATRSYHAFSLARSGRRTEALQTVGEVERSTAFVPPSALAIAYIGLGDRDRGLELLRAAYEQRDPLLQYLGVESHFDDVRADPRFVDLMTKVGLKP